MSRQLIDLTGQRFGKLTVVRRAANINNNPRWLCRCDCGNERVMFSHHLRAGVLSSCGCGKRKATPAPLPVFSEPVYRDDGCNLAPSCLACPLPVCQYDAPLQGRTLVRGTQIKALEAAGKTAEQIAADLGISIRSVYRNKAALKQVSA